MKDVIARLKERHGSRGDRYLSPLFSHPKGYSISNGIMNYPPHKPSMKDALIIANSSFLPLINIKK